jgi:hypothetical protein
MMPTLQAEEALQDVTRAAIGAGRLEKSTAQDVITSWRKAIGDPQVKPIKATAGALAAIGIGIRTG